MGSEWRLRTVIAFLSLMLMTSCAHAIDISVTGSWNPTTSSSDLISGAGSQPLDNVESNIDQFVIDISGATGSNDNWRLDVRRSDITWNGVCPLLIVMTSTGVGGGTVFGGSSYQAVTTSDTTLFSGSGDRNNIKIQMKITGISLLLAPDDYSTSLIFTVVDTL